MTAVEKWHGDCSVGEERPLSSPVVASSVETCKSWFLNSHKCYIVNGRHRAVVFGKFQVGQSIDDVRSTK